jgi:hypothetical protein
MTRATAVEIAVATTPSATAVRRAARPGRQRGAVAVAVAHLPTRPWTRTDPGVASGASRADAPLAMRQDEAP